MPTIRLPNGWNPREYQRPLWDFFENGGKRGVAVWHRRAGKDDVALHLTAVKAHERVGNYWHMLPEADQARKAIWTAINPHTKKLRIDEAFPEEIRKRTDNSRMLIEFLNGSTWQVVGSDNYNSLVGASPIGLVFSEWALADPNAWAYLRPILAENGGWALFIYTPRGHNHGATFFESAQANDGWFAQKLSARDTPVFKPEMLQAELAEYIAEFGEDDGENRFRQEYLCDFNAAVVGSYYGRLMNKAETDKRITRVPYEPRSPVYTGWDLGFRDATAIWFAQLIGREVRIIDFIQNSGVELAWYARQLKEREYVYEEHILPHDADASDLTSGTTRLQTLRTLNLGGDYRVLARDPVQEGINGVRLLIPRCWFDAEKCHQGIMALRNYRKEWDDKRKVFHDKPLHDWSSHAADAFRYLASGIPSAERRRDRPMNLPPRANNSYSPHRWRK